MLVTKRDARHYYHKLRVGEAWRPWLALPSVEQRAVQEFVPPDVEPEEAVYPCQVTAPMGWAPSAAFVQAVTDRATRDLPPNRRVRPDEPIPDTFPLWGSIIDDMWVVEEADEREHPDGPKWLRRAVTHWEADGVEVNASKDVDAEPNHEVQGYFVNSATGSIGVALTKRAALFEAILEVTAVEVPLFCEVERLVGKLGFVHSARAPLRSIL